MFNTQQHVVLTWSNPAKPVSFYDFRFHKLHSKLYKISTYVGSCRYLGLYQILGFVNVTTRT